MTELPDATWIREAETYGMPPYGDDPEPVCPICGRDCETIYLDKDGNEFGCNVCIQTKDAWEWAKEKEEQK